MKSPAVVYNNKAQFSFVKHDLLLDGIDLFVTAGLGRIAEFECFYSKEIENTLRIIIIIFHGGEYLGFVFRPSALPYRFEEGKDDFVAKRRQLRDTFWDFQDGKSTERLMDFVLDKLP